MEIRANILKECDKKRRYRYIVNPDYSMELWDNNTCTKMEIHLRESYENYTNRYYFKGMETDCRTRFEVKGLRYEVDFYGLDTKKTLSLDRKKIKKEALKQIQEILDSALQFYLKVMEEKLFADKEKRTEKEYNQIYTYWCMCSLRVKKQLLKQHEEVFNGITVEVDVLKKNDTVYENMKMDFKKVMSDLNAMVTIKNFSDFSEHKDFKESINKELIKNMLDSQGAIFPIVIVDKNFTEVLNFPYSEKIAVVSEGDNYMYLTIPSIQEDKLPHAFDDKSKNFLLNSMLRRNNTKYRHSILSPSMRRYIIGIADYDTICTSMIPFGIDGEWYRSIGYIIAPFTIEQWENNKHLSIDKFEKAICESKAFQNLINHTFKHQLQNGKYSKEDIREKYIDLIRELYIVATK